MPRLHAAHIASLLSTAFAVWAVGCQRAQDKGAGEAGRDTSAAALVAPVFEHGTGLVRGPWVISGARPIPVQLSEADARDVIQEELARSGIHCTVHDRVLDDVIISGIGFVAGFDWVTGEYYARYTPCSAPLEADLADPERHIYIEYVADDEYLTFCAAMPAQDPHDLKVVARGLAAEVAKQGRGYTFGVFYDPAVGGAWDDPAKIPEATQLAALPYPPTELDFERFFQSIETSNQAWKAWAKDQLRCQVQDFAEWLKGQGVI